MLLKRVASLFRLRDSSVAQGESMTLEHIDTQLGNDIRESLESDGWKVTRQYSPLAFDKGIDFDAYTLKKDGRRVEFEWTNWFEWTIRADPEMLVEIRTKFPPREHDLAKSE